MRFIRALAYVMAQELYDRQQARATGILVDSGIQIKPPIAGKAWPSCIPIEWREQFEGCSEDLASVLNAMLPIEWCRVIFRQKVQELSNCPAVDSECEITLSDGADDKGRFKLSPENVKDLIHGTRAMAGLLSAVYPSPLFHCPTLKITV